MVKHQYSHVNYRPGGGGRKTFKGAGKRKRTINVKPSNLQPVYRALASSGVPVQQVVKMRYTNQSSMELNTNGTTVTNLKYRASNIDEVIVDTALTQPLGHTQWKGYYHDYVVLGSRITIIAVPQKLMYVPTAAGKENRAGYMIALQRSGGDSASATIEDMVNQGGTQLQVSHPEDQRKIVLRSKYNAARFWKTDDPAGESGLVHAFDAVPPTPAAGDKYVYYHLAARKLKADGVNETIKIDFAFIIDYLVMCKNPITKVAS